MKRIKIDLTRPADRAQLAAIDATSEAEAGRQAAEDGAPDPDTLEWRTVRPWNGARITALRERLGLTRAQFAAAYGLPPRTVQEWEQNRREPDQSARSYLTVIEREPETVRRFYEGAAE